ncbi:type IV pilus biogenesis protein PilP [Cupriavidus pinatubonensis]|uniref:type IV pilus biogenesis protein PilP n=1 Tax=Cupriavidus pinatubonensis TaxID=248026 RepID=UPI0011293374|nr:type IV pilus biogenesis protein PilP [Cupriavidus pinatubonensis]TPQ29978.1 type IV pilus biogenesis protein PilP [Cupriavidus pinatubonensis]
MQNRAFIHRWAPVKLAAAAIVCQAGAFPANAASAMSNPAVAAIAAAGASTVPAQPASVAAAQPSQPGTPLSAANSLPPVSSRGSAGEAVQAPRHTDAPELAALQAQIALWKARAEIAKYKAEVKRAEDSLTAAAAGAAPSGTAPSISLAAPMPAGGAIGDRVKGFSSEMPRLVSLRAFDGQFNAIVDINGRTVPVQPGDALDGGWQVVSIDDGGVKLANGKRVRTLRP